PEGICCNAPCTGQCEACNAAGSCGVIMGSPVAPRPACNSDSSHPVCNGSGTGSFTCTYPTKAARGPSAGGPVGVGYTDTYYTCSNGTCSPTSYSCGNYNCNHGGGTSCGGPCTSNADCFIGTCHFSGGNNICG